MAARKPRQFSRVQPSESEDVVAYDPMVEQLVDQEQERLKIKIQNRVNWVVDRARRIVELRQDETVEAVASDPVARMREAVRIAKLECSVLEEVSDEGAKDFEKQSKQIEKMIREGVEKASKELHKEG